MKLLLARPALSLLAFILLCAPVCATPVTWTVGVNAPGAGFTAGSFTYDADTQQVLNWVFPFEFEGVPGTIAQGFGSNAGVSNGDNFYFSESIPGPPGPPTHLEVVTIYLLLAGPLTDAGGRVPLIRAVSLILAGVWSHLEKPLPRLSIGSRSCRELSVQPRNPRRCSMSRFLSLP